MREILVRLGATINSLNGTNAERDNGRLAYGRIELFPNREIPLLVNHDPERRIGTVQGIHRINEPFLFGGTKWWCAAAILDDDAPTWVKRGTPASFRSALLHEASAPVDGFRVMWDAVATEVSVLHGERPAEPLAQVLYVVDAPEPEPVREIIHPGNGQVLRRNTGVILGVR